MKGLLDNVNFLIIFIVIFILLLATAIPYIFMYLPIKAEYEKNILTNFALSVGINLKDAKEADTLQIFHLYSLTIPSLERYAN